MNKQIVLASASPRRKELLSTFGLPFISYHSDIDEEIFFTQELPVEEATRQAALAKAKKAQEKYPSALIIGIDTVVAIDSHILGKPKDQQEAKKFISLLSGKTHSVISGCALLDNSHSFCITDTTHVTLFSLTSSHIDAYLETHIWKDKAGGYAIQGPVGALLVESIKGCYYTVIGFPLGKLAPLFEKCGINLWDHLPSHGHNR